MAATDALWNAPRIRFALEAVRQASLMARRIQRAEAGMALSKEDRSPVTVADFSVQALVARRLAEAYPGEPLVAEEESKLLAGQPKILEQVARWVGEYAPPAQPDDVRGWIDQGRGEPGERFWTLDPIDGTQGFLRGEQYAVAFAYLERGVVELGVLGCPNLEVSGRPDVGGAGSLIVAARGHGCWARPLEQDGPDPGFQPLQVSREDRIERARVLRSVVAAHTNVSQFDELLGLMGIQAPAVCLDSQAKYGALAAGRGELLLRLLSRARPGYREKIWDQAAGSRVVQEAGGTVTDLSGAPLDFGHGRRLEANRGVLASNGLLHERALRVLESVGAASG